MGCGALGPAVGPAASRAARRPPNFVFILMDDMGWRDLGCFGSEFLETPNIDRLAREGVRFTNAYAASPLCSPTRASIMTGKYPARCGITYALGALDRSTPSKRLRAPAEPPGLPLEETTLAEALKPGGYTSALVGKWHLGGQGMHPEDQGFDLNVGGSHVGMLTSYFYPAWTVTKQPNIVVGGVPLDGKPGEYITDRLADAGIKFIEEHQDRPFLLFLSNYAVHTPIQAREELIARYRAKPGAGAPPNNPVYAAMIQSVDEGVGRVLAKLDQLKLAGNTVVFFMSDNGGLSNDEGPGTPATSNAPLREGKHFLYEGGIREPMIVKWPGKTHPGSVCDVPVISTDFLPTMVEMAGLQPRETDGVSLVPLLAGKGKPEREALYWHFPHYGKHESKPGTAVRKGNYKLIEFFDPAGVELYGLSQDIGEKHNLAGKMPGKVHELRSMIQAWRRQVNARMMDPNPQYEPPTR
jgi:arylsulfatase A